MEEYGGPATLTTPGGTVTFNDATGDTFLHDPTQCDGLGLMTDLRTSVDAASQTDGGLVHPSFGDARHVTLSGLVLVRSGGDYATARNALQGALETALLSIIRVDGTYSWTPTGGSLLTITVRCDLRVKFPAVSGSAAKNYVFGLVAGDPAIA
jgi:hypothetical protein